ncbi:hypothetical protein SAMN05446635_8430 [Burkholderia sp. OK233]|nr:hypothetical protein SAMN05446635_8430 [Burkholderia sp. OK233]
MQNYREAITKLTAIPNDANNKLTHVQRFYHFLGIFLPSDIAAAWCILIAEHPQFTPESLKNAKLVNNRGKSQLIITDNANSSILSLDKERAKKKRQPPLSPLAEKIIKDVIRWTTPIRNMMRRAEDARWRFLFLGLQNGGKLGTLAPNTTYLHSATVTSLSRMYPVFQENELSSGSFDYRRIRTTMGVLRWFETGSIVEMARTLGNSARISLVHYLPPALLHAWNTRIIRRFQNMLIALAMHDDEILLEVTDFSTISDLQAFVAQLIFEHRNPSDPLAPEIQRRLRKIVDPEDQRVAMPDLFVDSVLNVKISPTSLGYLYAFSAYATANLSSHELHRVDTQTGLAPKHFQDLARLFRHACENGTVSDELRELLDIGRLSSVHGAALKSEELIRAKFDSFHLSSDWTHHA